LVYNLEMKALKLILILFTVATYGQESKPQKLGIGILAIDSTYNLSKTVSIYKDKNFQIKLVDFKLYGENNRISPYYFKPDYGICYFVCIKKTPKYFKILINNKQEGFLKIDENNYFKTWESLLINATVERIDIKANPIKLKPNGKSETIKIDSEIVNDRLEVIDAIEINGEYWININYSASGKLPCSSDSLDSRNGWIKWKAGGKLLVKILLLC
jgi:hypothetical protein